MPTADELVSEHAGRYHTLLGSGVCQTAISSAASNRSNEVKQPIVRSLVGSLIAAAAAADNAWHISTFRRRVQANVQQNFSFINRRG